MNTTSNQLNLAEATVNVLIRDYPQTVEVFNRFGIDACCGGAASVHVAAERDGAEPSAVVAALQEAITR